MIPQRKKSNSSKVNLTISAIFHGLLIGAIFYFAAREGILGKKLQALTAVRVKEKAPEPPKPKAPEPKVEQPKQQEAKANIPQPKVETAGPPPAAAESPTVAPAAAVLPDISFSDGAIAVQTVSSPNDIYRALVASIYRKYWNRPTDMQDDSYAAEVEITIDKNGDIRNTRWVSRSNNQRWDESVDEALNQVTSIGKAPPKGFPDRFVVKFDVEMKEDTQGLQLGIN